LVWTEQKPIFGSINRPQSRVVAIFPQPIKDGQEYLKRLDISVDEIRQVGLDQK
jgi:hypothetical protein